MSITTWEDSGINWAEPQLSDLWTALESIRLALIERRNAVLQHMWTNMGTKPAIPDLTQLVMRGNLILSVVGELHDCLSKLIIWYIDHTYHNGDFEGLTFEQDWIDYLRYIQMFHEETLLAAAGETERIICRRLDTIPAWITQQYKLINALKWTGQGYIGGYSGTFENPDGEIIIIPTDKPWYAFYGGYYDFYAAGTQYYEGKWRDMYDWLEIPPASFNWRQKNETNYYVGTRATQFSTYDGYLREYNNVKLSFTFDTLSDCIVDVYGRVSGSNMITNNLFSNFGILYKIKTYTIPEHNPSEDIIPTTDESVYRWMDTSNFSEGFSPEYIAQVLKYDGPNGFKFRAPTP